MRRPLHPRAMVIRSSFAMLIAVALHQTRKS